MTSLAYFASSTACIGAIACLSQQQTARVGNALGMVGVSGGIAATMGALGADAAVYTQIAGAPLALWKESADHQHCLRPPLSIVRTDMSSMTADGPPSALLLAGRACSEGINDATGLRSCHARSPSAGHAQDPAVRGPTC